MARTPEKADGAFRTIREVADWLGVPTHVLRFWESKFDQIAPVKGAGGRRYYRPEDMRLLGGIKVMLHDQGLTIRGVCQKIDDDGTEPVMELSPPLDMPDAAKRTRRVIRNGEDTTPAKTTAKAEAKADAPADATDETAAAPQDDGADNKIVQFDRPAELDAAPDVAPADALPDQPDTDTDVATAPTDADDTTASAPDVPEDAPEAAPAEPVESHPPQPEVEAEAAAPQVEPVEDPVPAPAPEPTAADQSPVSRALELARSAKAVSGTDKMRLRRLIRRYKALADEIRDDLDRTGSG